MTTDFQFDVFLNHHQADKPRVPRLAERLRTAGLRMWFDEWIIQPGDDIYLAIERGLEASRTLACPAEASQRRRRRSTVLFRDPANAGRRLTAQRFNAAHTRWSMMIGLPDFHSGQVMHRFAREAAAVGKEFASPLNNL